MKYTYMQKIYVNQFLIDEREKVGEKYFRDLKHAELSIYCGKLNIVIIFIAQLHFVVPIIFLIKIYTLIYYEASK